MSRVSRMAALVLSVFWIYLLVSSIGCGRGKQDKKESELATGSSPITVEEWNDLSPGLKFDPSVLNRVRKSDSRFESDEIWEQFMFEKVAPEMKKATGN